MVWNCGGLAAHHLDELKLWMHSQRLDVAALIETHWTFSNDWSDDWHCIHSGTSQHRQAGILVLVSSKLCGADKIKWLEILPGRLLHVRLQLEGRPLDIIGCYQHTCLKTGSNLTLKAESSNMARSQTI